MCPTCTETGGFHSAEKHAVARQQIPAHLTWKPGELPPWKRQNK